MRALLLCLLAGCTTIDLNDHFECQTDYDCAEAGEICDQGVCTTAAPCSDAAPCPTGQTCSAGVCHGQGAPDAGPACTPKSCQELGAQCGAPSDGCGKTLECGTCGVGDAGTAVCDQTLHCCTPMGRAQACASTGGCGGVTDGCGGTYDCGACNAGQTCGGLVPVSTGCGCTPVACQPGWCGTTPNGCGGTTDCGNPCTGADSCGGGGDTGVCGARLTLQDGWQWDLSPSGGINYALWMTGTGAAQEGWAGGAGGQLLHWKNGSWNNSDSLFPGAWTLGIWGRSATDVYFAQGNDIRHFDGANWTDAQPGGPGAYNALNGGASDVWAAGSSGAIAHFTGSWAPVASGVTTNLYAIAEVAPGDVWAVGQSAVALHSVGGGAFQRVTVPGAANWAGIWSVWGTSSSDVWMGGDGFFVHWNGATFTPAGLTPVGSVLTITGTGPSDVWAAGYNSLANNQIESELGHWDGHAWTTFSHSIGGGRRVLSSIAASSTDVWMGGEAGLLMHWDGAQWFSNALLPPLKPGGITRVWGSGADDVWFSAAEYLSTPTDPGKGLLHWDGHRLSYVNFPYADEVVAGKSFNALGTAVMVNDGSDAVLAVYGNGAWQEKVRTPHAAATAAFVDSPTDGWIAIDSGGVSSMVHIAGVAAQSVALPHLPTPVTSIWGAAADDLWAVAGTQVLHFDGHGWSPFATGQPAITLRALGGSAASDVWAVGDGVLRWTGKAWQTVPTGAPAGAKFYDVSVPSAGTVFIAGATQGWVKFEGGVWTSFGGPQDISVFATSGTDVWFGGSNAFYGLTHWNGSGFDRNIGPITPTAFAAAAELGSGMLLAAQGDTNTYLYQPPMRQWTPWHGTGSSDHIVNFWGTNWFDNYFLTSEGNVWHDQQNKIVKELSTGAPLSAAWGPAAPHSNDDGSHPATLLWAVSAAGCWVSDGQTWSGTIGPCQGTAIHGSSATDVWVVGSASAAHWDGSSWVHYGLPGGMTAESVYVAPDSTAFAAGHDGSGNGVIAVWNGSSWTQQDLGFVPTQPFHRIFGTTSSNVWAGGQGMLFHWNGSSWSVDSEIGASSIIGLTSTSSSDLTAITNDGLVLH